MHGPQAAPTRALQHAGAAAVARHDHIRPGLHHPLGVDLRKRPHGCRQDVGHAHAAECLAHERRFTRAIGRRAHLKVNPLLPRGGAERLHRRLHASLNALPDPLAVSGGHMQRLRHGAQNALRIGMVARLQAQHLQAQRLQAVCASGGASSQDQIGLERDDALDVRVQPTAHARHRLDRLGPVGIAVQTHEFVALVQGADGFGEGRQQAHDALRGLVDLHFLLAIIEHGDGVCGLQYCAQKETGQRPQKPKFRRSREGGNPDA